MFSRELKSLGLLADIARLTDNKEALVSGYQYTSLLDMPNSKPAAAHETIGRFVTGSAALDLSMQYCRSIIALWCCL